MKEEVEPGGISIIFYLNFSKWTVFLDVCIIFLVCNLLQQAFVHWDSDNKLFCINYLIFGLYCKLDVNCIYYPLYTM